MQLKELEERLESAPKADEVERLRKQVINLQALQFGHVEQVSNGKSCSSRTK